MSSANSNGFSLRGDKDDLQKLVLLVKYMWRCFKL